MGMRTLALAGVILTVTSWVHAVDIAIDRGATYQTITGFGTQHIGSIRVKEGPFYITKPKTGIYDSLVNDLGLTMHRHFIPTAWDASHDHESAHDILVDMKDLHDRGVDVFLATLLGPPGYMKDNGIPEQGGHVLPEWYDSLGRTLVDYAQYTKRHTGIDYTAISIQNEPLFPEPYGSAEYTPLSYRRVASATATAFHDAGVPLRLFGPEHMTYDVSQSLNIVKATMADSVARPYFHAVAGHGYGADASSPGDDGERVLGPYARYIDTAAGGRLENWMTETSGYVRETWGKGTMWEWTCNCIKEQPGGMGLAVAILNSLKHGHVSLWCYISGSSTNSRRNDLLIDSAGPTILYHASKHFYRYIRPGAVQTASSSSDSSVLVVAFRDEARDAFSIVLINKKTVETTVNLSETSGAGLPDTFRKFVSSPTLRCEEVGTVSASDAITLPDSSVVTLYSGPENPVAVARQAPGRMTVSRFPVAKGIVRVYRLDGRLVGTARTGDHIVGRLRRRMAPGAYISQGALPAGRDVGATKRITVGAGDR